MRNFCGSSHHWQPPTMETGLGAQQLCMRERDWLAEPSDAHQLMSGAMPAKVMGTWPGEQSCDVAGLGDTVEDIVVGL